MRDREDRGRVRRPDRSLSSNERPEGNDLRRAKEMVPVPEGAPASREKVPRMERGSRMSVTAVGCCFAGRYNTAQDAKNDDLSA